MLALSFSAELTWKCRKSSGVAGAGQRWASSEVEYGLEVAVAVGSARSIALIVVAGCLLLIELARQVRESLRVAKIVSGGHDSARSIIRA